jgi:hypothetical protein
MRFLPLGFCHQTVSHIFTYSPRYYRKLSARFGFPVSLRPQDRLRWCNEAAEGVSEVWMTPRKPVLWCQWSCEIQDANLSRFRFFGLNETAGSISTILMRLWDWFIGFHGFNETMRLVSAVSTPPREATPPPKGDPTPRRGAPTLPKGDPIPQISASTLPRGAPTPHIRAPIPPRRDRSP